MGTAEQAEAFEGEGRQQRSGLQKIAAAAAGGLAAATVLLGATLATAPSASAPEPARLTQELSSSTGATGAAYYTYTQTKTTVVKWPGTWTSGSVAAGTPCSTSGLASGSSTELVIHAYNGYRKCM